MSPGAGNDSERASVCVLGVGRLADINELDDDDACSRWTHQLRNDSCTGRGEDDSNEISAVLFSSVQFCSATIF